MAVTYTKYDTTNFYMGLADPVLTAGATTYTVSIDSYIKSYAIESYRNFTLDITISNTSFTQTQSLTGCSISDKSSGGPYEQKITSGTATFTNVPPGTYNITVTFTKSGYTYKNTSTGNQVSVKGASHTRSVTLATLASSCTAPTTVTASGVITPTGSFTVTWSGASGGTNNPIIGYRVYYKVSADGSAPTTSTTTYKDVTSSATSGSTDISFSSSQTRGNIVVCGVVTKCANNDYWSGIKTGGSVKINQLPNKPTVTANKTTLPAAGGSVTFTISGSDPDGQTVTYGYTVGSSTTKTTIASGGAISISSSATYKFWTKDSSDEWSESSTDIAITVNTAPVITSTNNFNPTLYLAQGSTSDYVSSVSVTATCNEACTMTIKILYGTSATAVTTTGYTTTKAITGTSNTSIGTYNINSLLKDKYTGGRLYFRIQLSVSDGIDSSTSTSDSKYISSVWSIAAKPSAAATFDTFLTSGTADPTNVITSASYCYNKICIKYLEDESMGTPAVSAKIGSTNITATVTSTYKPSSGTNQNYRYINVTLTIPDSITSGTVTVTVTLADSYISKVFTASRAQLPIPTATITNAVTVNPSTINMYTTTSDITISCTKPCAFSNNVPVQASDYFIKSYSVQLSKTNGGAVVRTYTYNNSTTNLQIKAASVSSDILNITIEKAKFARFADFDKTTYNGTSAGYVRVTFTNAYNRIIVTNYKKYTLNYNYKPSISSPVLQYKTTSSGTYANISSNPIQENLYLNMQATITAYSNSTITTKLYYKIGSGSYNLVTSSTQSIGNQSSGSSYTVDLEFGKVSEIITDSTWTWKIEITNTATSDVTTNESITTNVIKHIAPTVRLTQLTATAVTGSNGRSGALFDYTYTIDDRYSNITDTNTTSSSYTAYQTHRLYTANGSVTTANQTTATVSGPSSHILTLSKSNVADTASDKATWAQKTIKVQVTTTVHGLVTTTKTAETNVLTVYMRQPTVAYRTNRLGINTDNPDSDAVLDVRSAEGKEVIRLGNTSGGGKIEIGMVSGSIYIDII